MLNRHLSAWALAGAVLAAGIAAADPPHADLRRPPTVFQDWRLSCIASCAVTTEIAGTDGSMVLRLAADREALVVTTPLALFLPDGLALALGDRPGWQVAWWTCGAPGCEARLTLKGEVLAALRRERTGSAGFTLLDGTKVRLPVSLLGFSAAWAARRD